MHNDIKKAFSQTTKILLGVDLGDAELYEKWLMHNVRMVFEQKSAVSTKPVYTLPFKFYMAARERSTQLEESLELGKRMLSEKDAQQISLSNAPQTLKDISYYTSQTVLGTNIEVVKSGLHLDSSYCYYGANFVNSKYCAYCMWPRQSEYIFGSDICFSSKFCINCYNSISLSRCFEVSYSNSCNDCMFCHNCEGCSDCIFCFNAKSLRYAIFNREYAKEEYLKIKKLVLSEISGKLLRDKNLDLNIYNLGCRS